MKEYVVFRYFVTFIVVVLLPSLAGCGGPSTELAPVSGSVSYQGVPLKSGTIRFEIQGARPATGRIVDGKIVEVTTFTSGDGAPVGKAQVAVFSNASVNWQPKSKQPPSPAEWKADSLPPMVSESRIPARYNSPTTSGLTYNLQVGENQLEVQLD